MIHVLANSDAPRPSYGHFRRSASHDQAKNFGIKINFFGSKSNNSKSFRLLSTNKEDNKFLGRAPDISLAGL